MDQTSPHIPPDDDQIMAIRSVMDATGVDVAIIAPPCGGDQGCALAITADWAGLVTGMPQDLLRDGAVIGHDGSPQARALCQACARPDLRLRDIGAALALTRIGAAR